MALLVCDQNKTQGTFCYVLWKFNLFKRVQNNVTHFWHFNYFFHSLWRFVGSNSGPFSSLPAFQKVPNVLSWSQIEMKIEPELVSEVFYWLYWFSDQQRCVNSKTAQFLFLKPRVIYSCFGHKVLNPEDWSCPSMSAYMYTHYHSVQGAACHVMLDTSCQLIPWPVMSWTGECYLWTWRWWRGEAGGLTSPAGCNIALEYTRLYGACTGGHLQPPGGG